MNRTSLLAAIVLVVANLTASNATVSVTIDKSTEYQTIDGFGFFGPMDVWWGSSTATHFWTDEWLDLIIDDLGLTIWRNEYYAAATPTSKQDAQWEREQKPFVQALKKKADQSGVPLKFIFSVWSPPEDMKCEGTNGCWGEPTTQPWSKGVKGGGTLCADKKDALAQWLVDGVKLYKDIGIDLYALSFQNEPLFCQSYNSCFYAYSYYAEVLKVVGPKLEAAHPEVKLFGAEHMLAANMNNGKSQFPYVYESRIAKDADAVKELDIWAYHGYSDGVHATPNSEMARLWSLVRDSLARYPAKPIWMTETSGYNDDWGQGGALELAAAMYSALNFGNLAGWVWWYGSSLGGPGDHELMAGTQTLTRKYYVSKQYFRYIRPGAVRVDVDGAGQNDVYVVAFKHEQLDNFVVLAINAGDTEQALTLSGDDLPSQYTLYRTTATEKCQDHGTVAAGDITLAAKSVNTLVQGNVYEKQGTANRAARAAPAVRRPVAARAGKAFGLTGRGVSRNSIRSTSVYFTVGPDGRGVKRLTARPMR